jgi:hypothetical protein
LINSLDAFCLGHSRISLVFGERVGIVKTLMAESKPHVSMFGAGRNGVGMEKDSRRPLFECFFPRRHKERTRR